MTNQELYNFIVNEFGKGVPEEKEPELEKFLRSLAHITIPHRNSKPTIKKLTKWLKKAYTYHPPEYDDSWFAATDDADEGFKEFFGQILSHVSLLQKWKKQGRLDDPLRYFGIGSFYNFDVHTYFECGVIGTFGRSETYEIEEFTWEDFGHLIHMGAIYE